MIIDKLKNAKSYYGLGSRMKAALEYLENTDFSKMEPGKYEVDGTNIYALVQQYDSRLRKDGKWEAHQRYADIQYIAEGVELMGYANLDSMKASQSYDAAKDIVFLEGNGDFATADQGTFVILLPQDVHMPGQAAADPQPVRKVVMKVLMD